MSENVKGVFKPRSAVWKFYEKVSETHSKCKTCGNKLKQVHGSTTSMAKHLAKHTDVYSEFLKLQSQMKSVVLPSSCVPKHKIVQQTLQTAFSRQEKYANDHPRAVSITNAIGKMLATDLQPFSMVQDTGFRDLMSLVEPKYSMPDRRTFARRVIPDLYEHHLERIKTKLATDIDNGVNAIALTTDMWTSRSNDSFLSLTAHYLDENFVPSHLMLGNSPITGEHTGTAIAHTLTGMFEKYNIPNSLPVYVVSDNARNIKLALSKTPWTAFSCLGHTLQLAINAAKKETPGIETLCKKARAIVGHYRRSTQARQRLHDLQVLMKISEHEIIQEVETRWNSEFAMLQRLAEQKEPISAEIVSSGSIDNLNLNEWKLAEGVVKVLEPLNCATLEFSSQNFPTISMIIPIIDGIRNMLHCFVSKAESGDGILFARNLSKAMLSRFTSIKLTGEYVAGMILDPRFKAVLLEAHEREKAIAFIQLIIHFHKNVNVPAECIRVQTGQIECQAGPSVNIWSNFEDQCAKNESCFVEAFSNPVEHEISRYLNEPVEKRHINTYDWWRENKTVYKYLSAAARRFLCIPATSVPSERLFSAAGNIVTSRMQCLSPDVVEQLMFLHENINAN